MTRFVKLREGAEAFAVNPDNICSLEGVAGGRETLVNTNNGGSVRLQLTIDEALARLAPTPEDWLDGAKPGVESDLPSAARPVAKKGNK